MKRRRLLRWIAWGGLAIFAVAVIAGGIVAWLVIGSLPQTSGALALESPGLSAPVTISRDAAGIVTITAATDSDGYFALGFAHAQDRLFQMEVMRRLGAGRLSEVFGAGALKSDKVMRMLGVAQQAAAQYEEASPELRAVLDSYAAGVNAFLRERGGPLPPEFQLLNFTPEPWRPSDSLIWGRIMAWRLSGNAGQEIVNEGLRGKVSPDLLRILMRAESNLTGLPGLGPSRNASNNWVLAGQYSASGAPLLANDPHLGFSTPAVWYLARIVTPDATLVGATAPGLPLLVIGSNGHVAWGFTTTSGDTQDLFEEHLSPDATQYETPTGMQPVQTRAETIKVEDSPDVTFIVRSTRHGPIISDVDTEYYLQRTFAISWTGFDAHDRTPEAILAMNRAPDAVAFKAALRDFHSPEQNVVYADTAGHIGFVAAGRVPIRRNIGNGSTLPVPGWLADYDWLGRLDFFVLPQLNDPLIGRIVTANNDIRPHGYQRFIGQSFDPPYRRDRIDQLLAPLTQATLDDFAQIQFDDYSQPLQRFVKSFLPEIAPSIPLDVAAALSGWDGHMKADRPEPLIATAWLYATARRILSDELGAAEFDDWWFWQTDVLDKLMTADRWCDDPATTGAETCHDAVRAALPEALDTLRKTYGQDWRTWSWGASHAMTFRHPVFSPIPWIGDRLQRSVAANGDQFTVNRGASVARGNGVLFADVHGPGLRIMVDMGQPGRVLFSLAGGQSGHPLSPNYSNLLPGWGAGMYRSFDQPAQAVLTLSPAPKVQP